MKYGIIFTVSHFIPVTFLSEPFFTLTVWVLFYILMVLMHIMYVVSYSTP